MRFIKTNARMSVNASSSFTIYITRTLEDAQTIHNVLLAQGEMLDQGLEGWHYAVQTCKVERDCRVPAFFHERGYWMTAVEHNRGSWDKEPTYCLYIAE